MSKKRFRKTLDTQKLAEIEKLGEKFAKNVKLDNTTSKCNAYIEKHRTIVLPLIVLLSAGMLVLGFSLDRARYNAAIIANIPPSIPTSSQDKASSSMIEDAISISDSIQALLNKGSLSPADSLYVINGINYLNSINQLSNTK